MLIARPLAALAIALAALGTSAATSERVREEQALKVDGAQEVWRLVWSGKTRLVCRPDEVEMAITCPCSGWAYGESGRLSLVRLRRDREVERLPLGPLFAGFEGPVGDVAEGDGYLQRWPERRSDMDRALREDPKLAAEIMRRPDVRIMTFGDYDHDGQASEFLVQVETLPCGKRQYMALGVSKANPRLHAIGSVAHPDKPLVLPAHAWAALLKSPRPKPVTTWQCGDHGSERHTDVVLSADRGRISVTARSFDCPGDRSKEKLVESETW